MSNLSAEAQLAVIQTTVVDMHHRLFGNGQPGEITRLDGRISATNERVTGLERSKWYALGAAGCVGFLIGVLGTAVWIIRMFR